MPRRSPSHCADNDLGRQTELTVISETARLAKKRARQRAAQERDKLVTEAVNLLVARLGDRLGHFVEILEAVDPMKVRERLREVFDQMPDANENVASINEETIARLHQERAARPRPVGRFVVR